MIKHSFLMFFLILPAFLSSINAQTISKLSQKRFQLTGVKVNDKVIFAGGSLLGSSYSKIVDIYDLKTKTWSVDSLSYGRGNMNSVSADGKGFFIGSSGIDIHSSTVDIYDERTGEWNMASIPNARYLKTIASLDNLVYIGGDKNIDMYDINSNGWRTKVLSQPRSNMCAVSSDKSVYFAGGFGDDIRYNTIDIYTPGTDTWEVKTLSKARSSMTCVHHEGKIYFAGGVLTDYKPTDVIDVYDEVTKVWSILKLSEPRFSLNSEVFKNEIYFIGGSAPGDFTTKYFNTVDILDPKTSVWRSKALSESIASFGLVSSHDTLFVAGGRNNTKDFDIVYLFHDTLSQTINHQMNNKWNLFPNPVKDRLTLTSGANFTDCNFELYNLLGKKMDVLKEEYEDSVLFFCDELDKGIYFIMDINSNKSILFVKY